jgi:hypothetical protein
MLSERRPDMHILVHERAAPGTTWVQDGLDLAAAPVSLLPTMIND